MFVIYQNNGIVNEGKPKNNSNKALQNTSKQQHVFKP
jgi:hypothetical protein